MSPTGVTALRDALDEHGLSFRNERGWGSRWPA